MAKRDYYEVLGVPRDVSDKTLKAAYRKFAMQYHPDRNPNDKEAEARFKEVNEAYEILKDDQKRAAYDRFGHQAFENGGGPGAGGQAGGFDMGGFANIFDEMFGEFMGGGRRGGGASRGADLRYNLSISLEDAFHGKDAQIQLPKSEACHTCKGTGAKAGTQPSACATCGGNGRVRAQQGFFTVERTCPSCQGQGRVIKDPCRDCAGKGAVVREKTLKVNIPAGVEDGTRIRLSGEGEYGGPEGQAGDLYIFLSLNNHKLFQRDGAHLYCKVPLTMTTAALGGTVEVPCLNGSRAKISIPAGTQSGAQFRLRGKGMPILRSQTKGDLYIQVSVEVPINLNKKQKELLEKFRSECGEEARHQPESHSFFSRMREFFDDLRD